MATLTLDEMVKFDDVFLGILQHCGKIEPFLDAIFYFLSRRTDFFHLMYKKDDKLGFPPGIAEKMLIKNFQKHQENVLKNDPKYMAWKNEKKYQDSSSVPVANNEVEVKTEETEVEEEISTVNVDELNINKTTSTKAQAIKKPVEAKKPSSKTEKPSDSFNGGVTDLYSWSQNLTDIDIQIPVPKDIKKSKELSIEIRTDSLKVCLRGDPPPDSNWKSRTLIEGTLSHKIRCEESLWSLLPGDHIALSLEKMEQKWWTCVMDGDTEIDKQSIDTTQQVSEFDQQTQADIRKVMYDQQQKLMGKPTSEEQKTHDLLKKAWDADGSPFKGTPFDPSSVNISNNGMPPTGMPPP